MRIIQDSDDEFDQDDLEVDVPPTDPNALQGALTTSAMPREPGIGSTDSFERMIQAGPGACLDSQPIASIPTLPLLLPNDHVDSVHPNKKRKICADASSSSPVIKHSEYRQYETPCDSPKTMREDYAQREPMAFFSDPSSTVPNATATQQRLLEEVMAPGFLGSEEVDTIPYEPAKCSVPWSDFLKTPSVEQEPHTALASQCNELSTIANGSIQDPSRKLDSQGEQHTAFQQDLHQSFDTTKRTNTKRTEEPLNQTNPTLHTPRKSHQQKEPTPVVSQRERRRSSVLRSSPLRNEIVANASSARQGSGAIIASKTPKKPTSACDSGDELADIGLPKEEYNPRLSRSRSLKLNFEAPIDYSVRPEKAKKKGARRSKTVGDVDVIATRESTPTKIRQICDMGFTPGTTKRALEQNDGDLNQTVNWLITLGVSEDELAPKSTRTRRKAKQGIRNSNAVSSDLDLSKVDLPEAQAENSRTPNELTTAPANSMDSRKGDTSDTKQTDEQPPCTLLTKSPKVQVVIPKSKVKEQPVQEKRGRGRPRKEGSALAPFEQVPCERGEMLQGDENKDVLTHQHTRDGPGPLVKEHVKEAARTKTATPIGAVPLTSESQSEIKSTLAASHSPEQPTKQVNDRQSPISNTKVTYRVGLSRRARIAPLLRIVKR